MTPPVRLSMRSARCILACLEELRPMWHGLNEAREELRTALASEPRRLQAKPSRGIWTSAFRKAQKTSERPAKEIALARRQDIRTAVFLRAGGLCECGCGERMHESASKYAETRGELDHMFGRGVGRLLESERTCWALRADCHRKKTRNQPDASTWWTRFADHCARRGYVDIAMRASGRAHFVETRASLPAAVCDGCEDDMTTHEELWQPQSPGTIGAGPENTP